MASPEPEQETGQCPSLSWVPSLDELPGLDELPATSHTLTFSHPALSPGCPKGAPDFLSIETDRPTDREVFTSQSGLPEHLTEVWP